MRGGSISARDTVLSFSSDFFYASSLLDRPWINVVAWTLAIEVQFYILVGLLLAVIRADRLGDWLVAFGVLLCCSLLLPDQKMIFYHIPIFVVGWAASDNDEQPTRWWMLLIILSSLALLWQNQSAAVAFTALGSVLAIRFVRFEPSRQCVWLGAISYSLYLLHVPIGGRVMNLGMRFVGEGFDRLFLIGIATIASIAASYVFWRFVERPSQLLSRRLA